MTNTQKNNTPAATYLQSREYAKVFMAIHQPIKTMAYVDDMCACISELSSEVYTRR